MTKRREMPRRAFLKDVTAAGGFGASQTRVGFAAVDEPAQPRLQSPASQYPRIYSGRQLAQIAFPLGGVAAGSISLGGRGQLSDWEVFNRADKGRSPQYGFAAVRAQSDEGNSVTRILEARLAPPYQGSRGLGHVNAPGLPRLESCTFCGEFPFARVVFGDSTLPVNLSLEAFTPFIPLDEADSGLPVAILRYRASNPTDSRVKVSVCFVLENPIGRRGRSNRYRSGSGFEGLLLDNPSLSSTDPRFGSFAVCALGDGKATTTHLEGWRKGLRGFGALHFWDDFSDDGAIGQEGSGSDPVCSLCLQREIGPGAHADYTFLLSWHFPNRTPEWCGWYAPKGSEQVLIGNHYCTRFRDAWEAAEYAVVHLSSLEARTRKFTQAIRETTIPAAVRDAAMSNLSTLVTPTCFRTADGEFHGFEGSNDKGGCCPGSCTHVWNYEAVTPFLFPRFSRSLREAAFGFCTDANGRMDFRQLLPVGKAHFGFAAADGQMGSLMKLYLDWQLSGDTVWLKRLWPAAKRALEFAWVAGGWDADRDGVMEGAQHNTYDIEFFGPNPLCGIWYLGALRAGEEMARAVEDVESAAIYRQVFERGSRWIDDNLFNGEYYIQRIQGIPKDNIAKGLLSGMGAPDTEHPECQLGDGCMLDQLAGQYMAEITALGALLNPQKIQKTLQSIYRYNYKRSLYDHESTERVFALNDEAALVICDYSRVQRPQVPFKFFSEVMTGFEYAAAALMIYRGMTAEGIEMIENIRRRYDGERRNPWDEAECGHHYARAMASWASLLALSGFRYSAATKKVTLRPRLLHDPFRSFWSTPTGWGVFSCSNPASGASGVCASLDVLEGQLLLTQLELARRFGLENRLPHVLLAGVPVRSTVRAGIEERTVAFETEIRVNAGERLEVHV